MTEDNTKIDRSFHIHADVVQNSNFGTGDNGQQQNMSRDASASMLSTPSIDERQKLVVLLNKVEQFWIDGLLKQSIHQALWIELGKQLEQDKLYQPLSSTYQLPNKDPEPLPANKKVSELFVQHQRLLVILGEPGAGKTMTLLDLAKDLLQQAKQDDSQPIPVIFNLSSWSTGKYTELKPWLIAEFKQKYAVSNELSRDWLDKDKQRVLPLLDGLDEVDARFRDSCVAAINEFMCDYQNTGMVVCCRIKEYEALSTYLQFQCAVALQALTQEQIQAYLTQAGNSLAGLKWLLENDAESRALACSPLMLGVMSLTYADVPADTVQQPLGYGLQERQYQLFEQYVEKALVRKGELLTYPKQYVKDKLSWLGFQMQQHGQSVFMLENLQRSWLSNAQKWVY
ncbi:MAG: NACHT domain-containing protein, partial [Thiotrichaceae bacterium]|nr:NACHT domain-containing protein [Thiotrichaceae bacterium]